MSDKHTSVERFSLSEFAHAKREIHRRILLDHHRQGKIRLPLSVLLKHGVTPASQLSVSSPLREVAHTVSDVNTNEAVNTFLDDATNYTDVLARHLTNIPKSPANLGHVVCEASAGCCVNQVTCTTEVDDKQHAFEPTIADETSIVPHSDLLHGFCSEAGQQLAQSLTMAAPTHLTDPGTMPHHHVQASDTAGLVDVLVSVERPATTYVDEVVDEDKFIVAGSDSCAASVEKLEVTGASDNINCHTVCIEKLDTMYINEAVSGDKLDAAEFHDQVKDAMILVKPTLIKDCHAAGREKLQTVNTCVLVLGENLLSADHVVEDLCDAHRVAVEQIHLKPSIANFRTRNERDSLEILGAEHQVLLPLHLFERGDHDHRCFHVFYLNCVKDFKNELKHLSNFFP